MKKKATTYEVYMVGPSGKYVLLQTYEEPSKAREHIANLRKLYGKHVQCGIKEVAGGSRFGAAVKKCIIALQERGCR